MSSTHPAVLQHHFSDLEQQHEAATMGMWAFLIQEILFFGGLFAGYTVYRYKYFETFVEGSHHLPIFWGTTNTAVLIGSSLTMALAVRAAQQGKRNGIIGWLIGTMILGGVFLSIKAIEYADKYHHHLIPTNAFVYSGPLAGQMKIFFSFYFAMTGMHALHMIIGIGIMIFLLLPRAARGLYTADYYNPVENFGLYWHFIDIVWIFLFALLYLIGGRYE